ncbi:magnesium/cobalt transporter CorA [Marivirga harenae]|uniref:magnesium/cobalt transporter CorA n=1 Tax=Marivirga harenae TaxID=2010992 RepID=UPI0026DF478F|nr:magnesium/cobalt transporter CorA [Marivirga harenae]WKV13624.1 magnesium/cobalt transporter CorA [Marivirga harenae]|tara:strand:+ start:268474 stop:269616 length:1143 start_codon:yes stop_codon:yes gene_type:complete
MDRFAKKIINLPKRLLVEEPLNLYSGIRGMFRESSKIAGLPPGSAVYTGVRKDTPFNIDLFTYRENHLEERINISIEEATNMPNDGNFHWLNIEGLNHVDNIKTICESLGIHPLNMEDILSVGQRPQIEDTGSYLFISTKMLQFDEKKNKTINEQVSFILFENLLITFQERKGDTFEAVRNRLRAGKGRIRKEGLDYLLYALVDTVVDHYFIVLEKFGDILEEIEERIMFLGQKRDFDLLYTLKRELIHIRRSVWPLREVISKLERDEIKLIRKQTRIFIRDVYEHTIQAIDSVETYRDFISSLGDLYQSVISNKLNQVMKTLTIFSVVFIPLTFIAGVYGINFENVPEFKWEYGYAYFWSLIIGFALVTLAVFKYKRWM